MLYKNLVGMRAAEQKLVVLLELLTSNRPLQQICKKNIFPKVILQNSRNGKKSETHNSSGQLIG